MGLMKKYTAFTKKLFKCLLLNIYKIYQFSNIDICASGIVYNVQQLSSDYYTYFISISAYYYFLNIFNT